MNLEEVTQKYYKTEEERARKLEQNQQHFGPFLFVMSETIQELLQVGIKFFIFEMNSDTIYVGLHTCCGFDSSKCNIEEYRNKVTEKIKTATQFVNVIWEL